MHLISLGEHGVGKNCARNCSNVPKPATITLGVYGAFTNYGNYMCTSKFMGTATFLFSCLLILRYLRGVSMVYIYVV